MHPLAIAVLVSLTAVTDGAAPPYAVGPRDVLDVRVYDEPDLSKEAVVDAAGAIRLPLLGAVHVAGLTAGEIERRLAAALDAGYVVSPQVFVTVKEYNSRRAVVLGMVKNPGPYALTGRTTLLELLARAGGLLETGGKNIVLVRRADARAAPATDAAGPLVVDADRLLRRGETALNAVVSDGDLVFVPKSDGVYVYGKVKKPGVVPFREGLTVLQAVSLAEGLETGANAGAVRVMRSEAGRERRFKIDLDRVASGGAGDLVLRPEDVVVVPESFF
jgi:polysaccharide export outer membrane protein